MLLQLQIYNFFLDSVRHLMQEQYIDELVFKCLTLECDLGSAVNRLITQPGQFAGTCIYHVEFGRVMLTFFTVKRLTLFFRVYSEWQGILSGVLCINPSLKRLRFQKRRQNKKKEMEKNQDSSQSNSELLFKLPSQLVCALA